MANVISYKGKKYVRVDEERDFVKYSQWKLEDFKEKRGKMADDLKTVDRIIQDLTKALNAAKKGDNESAKKFINEARAKNKSKANGFAFEIIHEA